MGEPMRTVSFKLPRHLDEALSSLARRRRSTRSAVVREALEAVTANPLPPGRQSVASLMRDLIGSVEGPGDLASNPKHMKGYGR